MTSVLIPSNFSEDLSPCIHELIETFPGLPLKVVLFHAFGLSSSITELLMLARRSKEEELVSPEFKRQCQRLVREQELIQAIEPVPFYGTTLVAFRNFLHAHRVEFIVNPANYKYQPLAKLSQDPGLFLQKCGLPVITVTPSVPAFEMAAMR